MAEWFLFIFVLGQYRTYGQIELDENNILIVNEKFQKNKSMKNKYMKMNI